MRLFAVWSNWKPFSVQLYFMPWFWHGFSAEHFTILSKLFLLIRSHWSSFISVDSFNHWHSAHHFSNISRNINYVDGNHGFDIFFDIIYLVRIPSTQFRDWDFNNCFLPVVPFNFTLCETLRSNGYGSKVGIEKKHEKVKLRSHKPLKQYYTHTLIFTLTYIHNTWMTLETQNNTHQFFFLL